MLSFRLLPLAALAACAPAQVVISQIYGGGGNAGATLRSDFIELFNRGPEAADVTGWSVQYASAAGESWQVTPLAGTIGPGRYYLVQQAQGTGGAVSLPAPDASGTIAMSATAAKVALVRDAAALAGASPAGPNLVELVPYSNLSNTTALVRRGGGCANEFATGAPNPRNSASPPNACGAASGAVAATIAEVQGGGPESPLKGKLVRVEGIVTARKSNGFFIQSEEPDDDPNTSEGLFVFTSATPPPAATRGNLVSVTGTVAEFAPASDPQSPPLTEIVEPAVSLVSEGHTLPEPVELAVPEERFEGMRVRVPSLTVVGASASGGVFYGVATGVPRPFREPGIRASDPLPEGAPPYVLRFDENPERIRIDSDAQPGAPAISVAAGATVSGVTGPLDYGLRTYTIDPDPGPPPAVSGGAAPRPAPRAASDELAIASLNLQRFSDTASGFEQRLAKASLAIRTALNSPDILGVQEAESLNALKALAARVARDSGPNYEAWLVEGNDPSGIDVGFLVNTARVRVLGVTQEGKGVTFTFAGRSEPLHDRPPLVLRAEVRPAGAAEALALTVIVNHLRSLIGVETSPQVLAKRQAQAEFLARLVQARQAGENVIVLGDFNAYPFNDGYVDVIGAIQGRPAAANQVFVPGDDLVSPDLIKLADLLPRQERYSYVQDGNACALDHILVSRSLGLHVSRYVYARFNADFPESLRNDATRPERLSDHDAPLLYLSLVNRALSLAGVVSAASLEPGPVAPGQIVTIFGTNLSTRTALLELAPGRPAVSTTLAGQRVLFDGIPAPLLYLSPGQISAVAPYGLVGKTSTELYVEADRRALTNRITLPVEPAVPAIFTLHQSGCGTAAILGEARRGLVVTFFAAGAGQTAPPGQDGAITGAELPRPVLPVSVRIGGLEAEVVYAGAAPALVSGALQVNARVPEAVAPGPAVPVVLAIGTAASASCVTIAVE